MMNRRFFPLVLAGLLTIGLSVVHILQAPSYPVNYADTNDLLLAVNSFSLAHPPGYPHLVVLLAGLHALLPNISLVLMANCASGVLMSMTSGILFLVILGGLRRFRDPDFCHYELPFGLALLWGSSPLYWTLASVVEVMPLGLLFLLLLLLVALYDRPLWIGILGMLAGLYHPLLFGIVGWVWIVYGWRKIHQRQTLIKMLLGIAIGLLVTVLLYWSLTFGQKSYGWELPQVWWQWIQWWTRAVYTKEGSAIEQLNLGIQLMPMMQAIWRWGWWWISEQFGWFWLGLAACGSYLLIRRGYWRQWLWWCVPIFGYGPALAAYVKYPTSFILSETATWWGLALRERMFYVLPLMVLPLATLGLWRLPRRIRLVVLSITCIWIVGYQSQSWGVAQGVNASVAYTTSLLNTLPQQAVVVVDSDEVFQFLFAQQVLSLRQDVMIVPTGMVLEQKKWQQSGQLLSRFGFSEDQKRYVADVVSTSLFNRRRVFLYNMDPMILSYLGLEGNPFYAMPYGWLLEISREPILALPSFDYGVSVQIAGLTTENVDNWFKGFRSHLATIHTQQAYYLARLGMVEQAQWHATIAKRMFYRTDSKAVVDSSLIAGTELYKKLGSYMGYKPASVTDWLRSASIAQQAVQWDKANYYFSRAVLLDPSRNDIRTQLMATYTMLGKKDEADAERALIE